MKLLVFVPAFLMAAISILTAQTVQDRLDSGETPCEIYESGEPLTSLYGKTYQGGLIFYLNTSTGYGLVAAPMDQSEGIEWCIWMNCPLINTTGTAIGTGKGNTTDIVAAQGNFNYAANVCENLILNGYDDWFLPSKDELNEMWENLADSDGGGTNSGPADMGNLGGFEADWYWSSSESDEINAWAELFTMGIPDAHLKTNEAGSIDHRLRAVRAFLCMGACCLPDGSCESLSAEDCKAANGIYRGDNISCEGSCQAIPTLSQWGLIILALCLSIIGIVVVRKRINISVKSI